MNEYNIRPNNTGVVIHAGIVEETAQEQIDLIAAHPAMRGLIAIMPDVHAGKGCVIGLTGRFGGSVIPNIVGVDLGCGVMTYKLDATEIGFAGLDALIRENVPLGFDSRKLNDMDEVFEGLDSDTVFRIAEIAADAKTFLKDNNIKSNVLPLQQYGTLGGGNHFLEVEKGQNGQFYLTIHSGSRNFGLKVANYFQSIAKTMMKEMNIDVPQDLEYLPLSSGGNDYLEMVKVAQEYAHYNRLVMLNIILRFFDEEIDENKIIESVHNYISDRDNIIRKGAISAHKGEDVVIPLHMGAGIVIGKGKGNKDYNYSAPHGAGRLYGRKDMFRRLDSGTFYSLEAYREAMDGIFSTSVCRETFDESPFAYKPWESIFPYVEETIDVEEVAKPVYNLKAQGEE